MSLPNTSNTLLFRTKSSSDGDLREVRWPSCQRSCHPITGVGPRSNRSPVYRSNQKITSEGSPLYLLRLSHRGNVDVFKAISKAATRIVKIVLFVGVLAVGWANLKPKECATMSVHSSCPSAFQVFSPLVPFVMFDIRSYLVRKPLTSCF